MTKIEWTDQTWNPIVGCSIVSPGCTNCYAMKMAARLEAMAGDGLDDNGYAVRGTGPLDHYRRLTKPSKAGPVWTGKLAQAGDHILTAPLRRKKPTMYFVNSMSDLFHEDVPDAWIDRVFAVMALAPQHTFQVLTKRSARMQRYFNDDGEVARQYFVAAAAARMVEDGDTTLDVISRAPWPLPNVWLGVSAERQQEADARIPDLLGTPAAVRFVSAEPLLGPIDFTRWSGREDVTDFGIDWIIAGGESGPSARPMHPDWARAIRDQCTAAGVAFFFKQWGNWKPIDQFADRFITGTSGAHGVIHTDGTFQRDHDIADPPRAVFTFPMNKSRSGRLLDGRTWDEYPGPVENSEPQQPRVPAGSPQGSRDAP